MRKITKTIAISSVWAIILLNGAMPLLNFPLGTILIAILNGILWEEG